MAIETFPISSEIERNPLSQLSPEDLALEQELDERFATDRLGDLCNEFLERGVPGINLKERINSRQFVVAYIPAESPYGDIGRSVETNVFAKAFKQPRSQVVKDYGKYDEATTFACVIDVSTDKPTPAGVLRIIEPSELGFKDVNDLVIDDPENNPWIGEIKEHYFGAEETYDPTVAWQRLGARIGVDLRMEESVDIATHASAPGYSGKNGAIDSVSMLFYHACLRHAMATGKKNLLAIFDIPPLKNIQQFGDPFDLYEGLEPHPYGGPYDTIPAFCIIERGVARIRAKDASIGAVLADGAFLNDMALMPNEYLPEQFSNEAVGLPSL